MEIKEEDIKQEIAKLEDETVSQEEVVPEVEPIVVKAKDMGWVPKEEFQGDPDTWVEAKEFVGRAPLYDAIHRANKQLKEMKEVVEASKKFNTIMAENAKKIALKELQDKLDQAAEAHDIKEVIAVQKQIDKQEAQFEEEKKSPPEEAKKTFESWKESNQWYESDRKMRHVANGYGEDIKAENPGIEFNELLEKVAQKIKEDFPEKFSNPAKQKAVAVTKTNITGGGKNPKVEIAKLPQDAKEVYHRLVTKNKVLSHEDFMKQYISSGGALEN
jgi:hypothetical protein